MYSGASKSPPSTRRPPPRPSPTGGGSGRGASRRGVVSPPPPAVGSSSSSPQPAAVAEPSMNSATTPARGAARLLLDLDLAFVVAPGLGRFGGDGDDEPPTGLAPTRGHRLCLAMQPRGYLVVHGVRAAAHGRHPPDHLTPVAGVEGAERKRVRRRDFGRRGAQRSALAGKTRVLVLQHPDGTVRVRERRVLEADRERAVRAVLDEDRHREVGDRLVARVPDPQPQVGDLGEPLTVGEVRRHHTDRELALRLVRVLALAASTAGGEGEDAEPRRELRSDPPPAPPSGGFAVLPQGAEQHTTRIAGHPRGADGWGWRAVRR